MCIIFVGFATVTSYGNEFFLSWHVHLNTSVMEGEIEDWHTFGTDLLDDDDDGAGDEDVRCCAKLYDITPYDVNWTYVMGDE